MADAGVYFRENDQSTNLIVPEGTRVCFFGWATKGEPNELTFVSDEADLIKKFGQPLTTDYGLQAAIQTLRRSGGLYYVRITDASEAKASVNVTKNPEDDGCTPPAPPNVLEFEAFSAGTWGNELSVEISADEDDTYSQTIGVDAAGVPPVSPLTGNLSNPYVVPTTVEITLTFQDATTPGIVTTDVIQDDGVGGFTTGTFINAAANSTINYQDGAYSVTWVGIPAVVSGSLTIVVTYRKAQYTQVGFNMGIGGTLAQPNVFDLVTDKDNWYEDTWRLQPGSVFVLVVDQVGGFMVTNGVKFDDGAGAITFPIGVFDDGAGNPINITVDYDTGRVTFPGAAAPPHLRNQTGVIVEIYLGYRDPFFKVDVIAPVDVIGQTDVVETFFDCVQDSGSPRYVDTVINEGILSEVSKSEYVTADSLADCLPEVGTFALSGGSDGTAAITDADYIGTYTAGNPTGLKVIDDAERVQVDIVAIPGVSAPAVVAELLAVMESRGDSYALVDPPFGQEYDDVMDWTNGKGIYTHAQFDSSYGGCYWGWLKGYDAYNRQEIWLPPSGYVAPVFCYNDEVGHPWTAPAGETRGGIIGATDVEYNVDRSIRDLLVTFPEAVNPIVDLLPGGLTVWNTLTLHRRNTHLREVNVRRLVNYIKRTLIQSCRVLTFELNNEILWGRFRELVIPFLQGIATAGGLSQFIVICDGTINTPDSTKMYAKIIVVPVLPAKEIIIDFTLTSSGRGFAGES